ncbi:unnamed protein product [Ilex paraguariensis]|uniref:Ubiquitin thioesterase OTU n=1 Tax=Ilex paraguariensis TaxID=185542 RepID=A0ABC8TTS0_9AQUA
MVSCSVPGNIEYYFKCTSIYEGSLWWGQLSFMTRRRSLQSANVQVTLPKGAFVQDSCSSLVCNSKPEPVHAEVAEVNENKGGDCDSSSTSFSHGKKVYTDYSVIGISGDGRCLFRSVTHGACLQSGKPAPNETLQRELADKLRARTLEWQDFINSHDCRMPITVYMNDKDSGGLISIAEYGQEYGKDSPIEVLYHGFGHYDALQIPGNKGARSRL